MLLEAVSNHMSGVHLHLTVSTKGVSLYRLDWSLTDQAMVHADWRRERKVNPAL